MEDEHPIWEECVHGIRGGLRGAATEADQGFLLDLGVVGGCRGHRADHMAQVATPSRLGRVATRVAHDGGDARVDRRAASPSGPPGEWLPEPVSTEPGPEDVVTDRSALSLGVLVMMESLSPLERAVFVLRRGFNWPYEEIAEILDRSPEAVRQLDHRARQQLRERPERFEPDPERVQAATERFLAACGGGSFEALIEVLAPDVVLHSDAGGEAKAPPRQIAGADKVGRFFIAMAQTVLADSEVYVVDINGLPGLITLTHGELVSALAFDLEGDRITDLYLMAAPSKLGAVRRTG